MIRSILSATGLPRLDRASKIGGCLLLVSLGSNSRHPYLGIFRVIAGVHSREGITHEQSIYKCEVSGGFDGVDGVGSIVGTVHGGCA